MEDTVVIDALTPAATTPDTAADLSPVTTAPTNAIAVPPVAAILLFQNKLQKQTFLPAIQRSAVVRLVQAD